MLKELFNKYNCDKSSKHSYDICYEKDFQTIKNANINLLEIGIFKGESMKAWLDYFPNANVYGIDIFDRVHPDKIEILKNSRVKYLKLDSTSKLSKEILIKNWNVKFDIIIDDGLHTPDANRLTFLNFIDFLKDSGTFYIEDVWPIDKMKNKFHPWFKKSKRTHEYTLEKYKEFLNVVEKYQIEHIDNRSITKEPDSYIIKVKKNAI